MSLNKEEKERVGVLRIQIRAKEEEIRKLQTEWSEMFKEMRHIQSICSHTNKAGDGTSTQYCTDCGADPV